MKVLYRSHFFIGISLLALACDPSSQKSKQTDTNPEQSDSEYNLSQPEKFILPESLLEVSGIALHNGNGDSLYAIQDENGTLFKLEWGNKEKAAFHFGKQGDYEDLTLLNNHAYVLRSSGDIFEFPIPYNNQEPDVTKLSNLLPKGEYEAMYGDQKKNELYILCKNCPIDASGETLSGYIIKLSEPSETPTRITINVKEIEEVSGKKIKSFKPSGISRSPITGSWYIISAVNKMMVIADQNLHVRGVEKLSGNAFNQPEGITFDNAGSLYISNEGDDFSSGNILKFTRRNN